MDNVQKCNICATMPLRKNGLLIPQPGARCLVTAVLCEKPEPRVYMFLPTCQNLKPHSCTGWGPGSFRAAAAGGGVKAQASSGPVKIKGVN
jgi:hypothetical protein